MSSVIFGPGNELEPLWPFRVSCEMLDTTGPADSRFRAIRSYDLCTLANKNDEMMGETFYLIILNDETFAQIIPI